MLEQHLVHHMMEISLLDLDLAHHMQLTTQDQHQGLDIPMANIQEQDLALNIQ